MFSGIVEALSPVLSFEDGDQVIHMTVAKPVFFDDLKTGDSIANDGVCLTLVSFDSQKMLFTLGHESIAILQFQKDQWKNRKINLERSIRFGDRVHGHLVSGHVDGLAKITRSEKQGDSWFIDVEMPNSALTSIWKKGSITLNGVSLTVNEIKNNVLSVCLIPETVQRTNLTHFSAGQFLHYETDYLAKAAVRASEIGVTNRV